MPATMPDGGTWPSITILTTSYNQAPLLEETLRSVLLQGYPDVEHIVVDGGSSDGSVDVIKKYAPWLVRWTSVPDRGPEHALNGATPYLTGALIGLMPTSDLYLPGAFRRFATAHRQAPGSILLGSVEVFRDGESTAWTDRPFGVTLENALIPFGAPWTWSAIALMVPAAVYRAAGPFDEKLSFCSDEDWLCRLLQHAPATYIDEPVARARIHANANTPTDVRRIVQARLKIAGRYRHLLPVADSQTRTRRALHEAAIYLAHHPKWAAYWDRRAAMRVLIQAMREDPAVIIDRHFLRLLRRGMTPKRWLRSRP